MARKYSRKKGKSRSNKPAVKTAPKWTRYKDKEIELLVVKLSKEGQTSSQIGLHLRDVYGIPDIKVITKKPISKILEEHNLNPKIPEDLMALMKKAVQIRKHMEQNGQDKTALRGLQLTESKIGKLVKYYKKNNKLAKDWKYDPRNVKLLAE
jgi:small subunit ribosomal protein S15